MPELKPWIPGQRLTAKALNAVVDLILRTVIGGNGIAVRRAGNQIVIELVEERIIPKRN